MTRPMSRRLAIVERDLRNRGCTIQENQWVSVACNPPNSLTTEAVSIAVIPLTNGRPLSVVSAIDNAAQRGQIALLVADQHTRTHVRDILSSPFALAGLDDGRRQFYAIEDRIRLTDGTFACVDAAGPFQWREEVAAEQTDDPNICLSVGDELVAVLCGTEELTCPGPDPAAFPTRYKRTDRQFQVLGSAGVVGTYSTITSMRADGYRPAPLPLVPEHHFRENATLARNTLLAEPVDDGVIYEPIQ